MGHRATGSLGIRDDLVNAGATWTDEPAFRDGNLVWGRVVEDIPAHVCDRCGEQFYDEDVSDALRALSEQGFPPEGARRTETVPVFSLLQMVPTGAVVSQT